MKLAKAIALSSLIGLIGCAAQAPDEVVLKGPGGRTTTVYRQLVPSHAVGGLALSSDGARVLLAGMGHPSNELLLIDLASSSVQHLNVRDPEAEVFDPAFSRDGRRFVSVVDPSPRLKYNSGPTELVVAETESTAPGTVVLSDGYRRIRPAFSPDGQRIAYFRSIESAGLGVHYALFEYDLGTRKETRLARQAFGIPSKLFYHPADTGFFLMALNPLDPVPGKEDAWEPRSGTRFWTGDASGYNLWLPRGGEFGDPPASFAPPVGNNQGFLLGVTAAGDPALNYGGDFGVFRSGSFHRVGKVDFSNGVCAGWTPDAAGTVFIAEVNCVDEKSRTAAGDSLLIHGEDKVTWVPLRKLTPAASTRILR